MTESLSVVAPKNISEVCTSGLTKDEIAAANEIAFKYAEDECTIVYGKPHIAKDNLCSEFNRRFGGKWISEVWIDNGMLSCGPTREGINILSVPASRTFCYASSKTHILMLCIRT